MAPQTALVSPRLLTLQRELEAGELNALDVFWQEVATQGAPLVESIGEEEYHAWVTFLWRGGDEINTIVILSTLDQTTFEDDCWNFAKCQFTHLPGTDVWYRTYRLRDDARFTYQLSPNDSLIPCSEVEDWDARRSTWQPDPLNPNTFVYPPDDEDANGKEIIVSR